MLCCSDSLFHIDKNNNCFGRFLLSFWSLWSDILVFTLLCFLVIFRFNYCVTSVVCRCMKNRNTTLSKQFQNLIDIRRNIVENHALNTHIHDCWWWFSPVILVSSINKTNEITGILFKVVLNIITLIMYQYMD